MRKSVKSGIKGRYIVYDVCYNSRKYLRRIDELKEISDTWFIQSKPGWEKYNHSGETLSLATDPSEIDYKEHNKRNRLSEYFNLWIYTIKNGEVIQFIFSGGSYVRGTTIIGCPTDDCYFELLTIKGQWVCKAIEGEKIIAPKAMVLQAALSSIWDEFYRGEIYKILL